MFNWDMAIFVNISNYLTADVEYDVWWNVITLMINQSVSYLIEMCWQPSFSIKQTCAVAHIHSFTHRNKSKQHWKAPVVYDDGEPAWWYKRLLTATVRVKNSREFHFSLMNATQSHTAHILNYVGLCLYL